MSKIINDLKRLLDAPPEARQGTVQSVVEDIVTVASFSGPQQFQVANPKSYKPGDGVRFQGALLIGKVADESRLRRYRV